VGHQTLMLVAICAGGYAGISALGCAGSPTQAGGGDNFDTTPSGTPASADTYVPKHESSSGKDDPLTEDQKAQMEIALRRGGVKASNCASVVPDAARGEGEVKVTFDGKKGRAVDVAVPAPWAGTPSEACIKRAFVGEIIVPFEGNLEVPYAIKLGAKANASKTKDPKKK
jgi:hypothetical protein